MNSKLAGTTMGKNSFGGVVALKRAGLVSTFQTVYMFSARLQEKLAWHFTAVFTKCS